MSHAVRTAFAMVLALGVAAMAYAQSSQANPNAQQAKQKKHANQVPDNGTDSDPDPAPSPFERVVENVPVTVRADGTLVGELDDSFMEAVTATVDAGGSVQLTHFTGLGTASDAVRHAPVERLLPSRQLPALFPILEEKE